MLVGGDRRRSVSHGIHTVTGLNVLLLLAAGLARRSRPASAPCPCSCSGRGRPPCARPSWPGDRSHGGGAMVGLLLPGLEDGSVRRVTVGTATGVVFLLGSDRLLAGQDVRVGTLTGAGVRQSILVLSVLFVHASPEGMAMGTAYASERDASNCSSS